MVFKRRILIFITCKLDILTRFLQIHPTSKMSNNEDLSDLPDLEDMGATDT